MKYSRVYIDAMGYELAPVVVTSAELEARLSSLYRTLRIPEGQLEAWTATAERELGTGVPMVYRLNADGTFAGRKDLTA